MKMFHSVYGRIARTCLWIALISAGAAHAQSTSLPGVRFLRGTLVSSDDAISSSSIYRPGTTTHSQSVPNYTRPAEIVELANGLGANQVASAVFAQRANEYVYSNIRAEFMFGLQKGAEGALIDQSGTPFDQAHLLGELLKVANIPVTYQIGVIQLTAAQFTAWTGISNPVAACRLLADGGIPGKINGTASATCDAGVLGSTLSSVSLLHVWVSANNELYDPSFKTYQFKQGIDLASAMGCGSASAPTCGTSAMSAAAASTTALVGSVSEIGGVNQTALENNLSVAAMTLKGTLDRNYPNAGLIDIIGGQQIDPTGLTAPSATLPYGTPTPTWSASDIPDQFRTTLAVQFDNINAPLFTDEIAGLRLHLFGTTSGGTTTTTTRNMSLFLDYALLASSSYSQGTVANANLTLSVNHPYAANGGTYMDETYVSSPAIQQSYATYLCQTPSSGCGVTVNGSSFLIKRVTIVAGFGYEGKGAIDHATDLMKRNRFVANLQLTTDPSVLQCPSDPAGTDGQYIQYGPTSSDQVSINQIPGCLQLNQPVAAATWLAETSNASELIAAVNSSRILQHHMLGTVSSTEWDTSNSTLFDVVSNVSVISKANLAADRRAAVVSYAMVSSRLEGAPDRYEGGSSVSLFARGNLQHEQYVQLNSPTDWSTASGSLANYPAGGVGASMAQTYLNAGDSVLIPQNWITPQITYCSAQDLASGRQVDCSVNITKVNWAPASLSIHPDPTDPTTPDRVTLLIDGLYKGAADSGVADPYGAAVATEQVQDNSLKARKYYGVDENSGALRMTPPPDLKTGAGDLPFSLPLIRTYNSNNDAAGFQTTYYCTPGDSLCGETGNDNPDPVATGSPSLAAVGNGWQLNWDMYVSWTTDVFQGLGEDSPVDAVAAITALYTLRTLNASGATLPSNMSSLFVANWMSEQFYYNAVVVSRPPASDEFVRLPDGSFNAPPHSSEVMVQTGQAAGPYASGTSIGMDYGYISTKLTGGDGSVLTFNNVMLGQTASSWQFPNGVVINFSYTPVANSYKSAQCLATVSNNLGRTLTFTNASPYFPCGVSKVTDENGRSVTYALSSNPSSYNSGEAYSTLTVQTPDLATTTYQYTNNLTQFNATRVQNVLTSVFMPTDAVNPFLTVNYDSLFRVKSVTDALSQATRYYAGSMMKTESLKRAEHWEPSNAAPNVAVTTTYFDLWGQVLETVDPLGRITAHSYDARERLLTTTYPELNIDSYTYDARHNKLSTTRSAKPGSGYPNLTTSIVYNEGPTVTACVNQFTCNQPYQVTDELGRVKTFSYLSNGQLQRTVDAVVAAQAGGIPGSPQTDYCYASYPGTSGSISLLAGNIKKVDPSTNRVTSYDYNTSNHLSLLHVDVDPTTTLVPPSVAGGICSTASTGVYNFLTTLAFDAVGNLASVTDPLQNTTNYTFDAERRLTTVNAPLSALTRYCYDADGLLVSTNHARVSTTDPYATTANTTGQCAAGFQTRFWRSEQRAYFSTGDLRTVTDANGDVTTYAYDPVGRQQVVQDGDGRQTATVYDLAGQVLTTWHGGSGWINTSTGLPVVGNIPASWTPSSYTSSGSLRYGAYTYTPNGTRHSETDADNNTTSFTYDGFDRLTQTLYADGLHEDLWYAPDGNPATTPCSAKGQPCRKFSRSGNYVAYTYDALDRQVTRTPQVEAGYTYGYNLLGEQIEVDKLALGSTPSHRTQYAYDTAGHKQSETNDGLLVGYKFDGNDNRTRLTWPDGYYVQYSYDALNRMTCAQQNGSTELAYYNYDPLSQLSYVRFAGQGTNCQPGAGTNEATYGYESNGDLSSLTQVFNGSNVTLGYGHNFSHQITALSATDPFYLPKPAAAITTAYVPNALNQYGSVGGNTMSYDPNGNLKTLFPSSGAQAYTFDTENRLITVAVAGSATPSVFYDYDALERRTTTTYGGSALGTGGTTTKFLADGDEEIAELDAANNLIRRYIPGRQVDDRIAVAEGSSTLSPTLTYFHVNHQGSAMAMTDAAGNAAGCAAGVNCQKLAYDEYGNLSSDTVGGGEPYRFAGRRFDNETGLYYYRARYYASSVGRFMQMDSIGSQDDLNVYAYVGNDPLDRTDPSGNVGELAVAGCAISAEVGCAPGAVVGAIIEGIVYVGSAAAVAWGAHKAIQAHNESAPSATPAPSSNTPDRTANDELRTDSKTGAAKPDPEAEGAAHSQLGTRNNSKSQPGKTYPRAQEFDAQGQPVREIDFTDHGMPKEHPNPHEHKRGPEPNPGAGRKKGPPTPLPDNAAGPQRPKWWIF